jgi:hypothetical protein
MKKTLLSNLWKLLLTTGVFLALTTTTAFALSIYAVIDTDGTVGADNSLKIEYTCDTAVQTGWADDDTLTIQLPANYPQWSSLEYTVEYDADGVDAGDEIGIPAGSGTGEYAAPADTLTVKWDATDWGSDDGAIVRVTITAGDAPIYADGTSTITWGGTISGGSAPSGTDDVNVIAAAAGATLALADGTVGATQNTTISLTLPTDLDESDEIIITFPANIEIVGADIASHTFSGGGGFDACSVSSQDLTCAVSAGDPLSAGAGTLVISGASALYTKTGQTIDLEIDDEGVGINDIATTTGGAADDTTASDPDSTIDITGVDKVVEGGNVVVTFDIDAALANDDTVRITFPAHFDITSAAYVSDTFDGTGDNFDLCSDSGQVLTCDADESIAAENSKTITISGVVALYAADATTYTTTVYNEAASANISTATNDDIAATTAADAVASILLSEPVVGATTITTLTLTTAIALTTDDTVTFTMPANFDLSGLDAAVTGSWEDNDPGTGITCAAVGQVITCTTDNTIGAAEGTIIMTGITSTYVLSGTSGITDLAINDESATPSLSDISADTDGDITTTTVADLTAYNVQPSSLVAGTETANTITLTTVNVIPSQGRIAVTYPSGWDVSGTSGVNATNLSGMDGTWTASVSGQVVTFTQAAGGSETSVGDLSFVIPTGVVTPQASGSGGTYTITTQIGTGAEIDTKSSITADTITGGSGGGDSTGPGAPSNLTASVDENLHVVLTWDDPLDSDFKKIQIIRSKGEGVVPESIVAILTANADGETAETYTDEDVAEGEIVNYRLRPLDINSNYGTSATVTVTVEAGAEEAGEEVVIDAAVDAAVEGGEEEGEEAGEEEVPTDEELYEEVTIITEAGVEITLIDIGGHWAEAEVEAMAAQEIVTGDPDGSFRPSGNLNRAEAAALLHRVLGLGEPLAPSEKPFPDVDIDKWYAGYIADMEALEMIHGYGDGLYRPGKEINRAEFIKIALEAYYYAVDDEAIRAEIDALMEGEKTDLYEDLVDDWYTPYVTAATEMGFVHGSICDGGRCFKAGDDITRAEATVILYNMFYEILTAEEVTDAVDDAAAADDAAADDAAADDAAADDAAADDAAADDAAADDAVTYDCTSDLYNCSDYTTQAEAQAVYDYCMIEVETDVHVLDADENSLACEELE